MDTNGQERTPMDRNDQNPNIVVEITDVQEFHCFKLILNPKADATGKEAPQLEIYLHARSLVDLIHKCSSALCDWQKSTTDYLLERYGVQRR
jgi:hypothetical protein